MYVLHWKTLNHKAGNVTPTQLLSHSSNPKENTDTGHQMAKSQCLIALQWFSLQQFIQSVYGSIWNCLQWFKSHIHTHTVDKGPFSRVCFPLVNSRASLLNGLPPPAPLISSSHMDSPTENEKEAVKELQERGWIQKDVTERGGRRKEQRNSEQNYLRWQSRTITEWGVSKEVNVEVQLDGILMLGKMKQEEDCTVFYFIPHNLLSWLNVITYLLFDTNNATVISYQLIFPHTTTQKQNHYVTWGSFRPAVMAPWNRLAKRTNQQSVNVFKDSSPIVNHPHFHMPKKEKKKPHEIIIVTAPDTHPGRGDFTSHSSLLTEEVPDSSCRSGEVMKTDEISFCNAIDIKMTPLEWSFHSLY